MFPLVSKDTPLVRMLLTLGVLCLPFGSFSYLGFNYRSLRWDRRWAHRITRTSLGREKEMRIEIMSITGRVLAIRRVCCLSVRVDTKEREQEAQHIKTPQFQTPFKTRTPVVAEMSYPLLETLKYESYLIQRIVWHWHKWVLNEKGNIFHSNYCVELVSFKHIIWFQVDITI